MKTFDVSTMGVLLHLVSRMESTLAQLLSALDAAGERSNHIGGHAPSTLLDDKEHWERVQKWLEQGRELIDR